MGVVTTGLSPKLLWPGLNKVFGTAYNEWPDEYSILFDKETSSKAYEEDLSLSGTGLAVLKTEGGGITYDDMRQEFLHRYIHKTYALGIIFTEEFLEDNQYDMNAFFKKAKSLKFSMKQTMEILAANVYNRAFTAGYTFGDGKTLCASDHPTAVGGSFSNMPSVASDLSEASLEQAAIDIAGFKDSRGNLISIMPETLIISKENLFEAERILKSTLQNDSANNAINALRSTGMFRNGAKVNHYFTDPDAWFIRTNCPNGMKMFERKALSFAMDNDFDTSNAKYKASFRVSFGMSDPRGIYGSAGA